ncbi:MAG: response regulator [Gemmataceae bacterium]|nr:response regulator [Gemmataceae bacterium]
MASTCRVLFADHGHHRLGLECALKDAGVTAFEACAADRELEKLGLLELNLLLEWHSPSALADFFPEVSQLEAWRAFVCVNGSCSQPALVLVRTDRQAAVLAMAAHQEVINMIRNVKHKTAAGFCNPRSAALRRANRADERGARMSSELVHDLNNFLTVIRGNCQMLLNTRDVELEHSLVREIDRAGEKALLLTRQFDAAPEDSAPPEIRDGNESVEECAGLLTGLLAPRQELRLNLAPGPAPVRIEPGQLERLLVNLVANARDAIPGEGVITVSTLRLADRWLLRVSDTGQGMDQESVARLMEGGWTTKECGHGLGFAIVRKIAEQHGGAVEVRSSPGQGTTCNVFFPLAEFVPNGAPVMDITPSPALEPETILLVEDEAMVRSIFRRILQESGYCILEAANGMEALTLAEQFSHTIHVLVTDLAMPLLNGLDLARQLSDSHPEAKVLFLSGYSDGTIPGFEPLERAHAFLQKPFKADALVQKVRELLNGVKQEA